MSMTISTGDDADELDEDTLERDDDRDDEEDDDSRHPRGRNRDDDEADDEDDDLEDKSDEELRADIKRLRASLAKANSAGQRRRQQLKELRAKQAEKDSRDDEEDDSDDDEEKPKQRSQTERGLDAKAAQRLVSKAVKKRETELQQQYTKDLIDTRMESKLAKAGADDKAIRLLKREIDYDELELLGDRTVDGADEEIERLKAEYPAMFRGTKGARRRINGGDDRDTSSRKRRPMTTSEQQAAKIQGRS